MTSASRRAPFLERGRLPPARLPARLLHAAAEEHGVVEGEVRAPDPLRAREVVLEERLLRVDALLRVFGGGGPGAVVEARGIPAVRDGQRFSRADHQPG